MSSLDDANFATQVDRLQRITAELVHIRDVMLRPVPATGEPAGVVAHYHAMAVRFREFCEATGASPLASMSRLMELAIACGSPAPADPAVVKLLDATPSWLIKPKPPEDKNAA